MINQSMTHPGKVLLTNTIFVEMQYKNYTQQLKTVRAKKISKNICIFLNYQPFSHQYVVTAIMPCISNIKHYNHIPHEIEKYT